jgi:O-antigen ligase
MIVRNLTKINLTNINSNLFIKLFFMVLLLELFLLGSGRLLEIGSLTARMIIFTIAISLSVVIVLYTQKIERKTGLLLLFFLFIVSISTFSGLVNSADIGMIVEDLKPLFFFLVLLPFSLFIRTKKDIALIVNLIKNSSFILAILYLLFLVSMYSGILDFSSVYRFISLHSDDIMFRGASNDNASFFYKGFLYLNIGFIFYIFSKNKYSKFFALILFVAILLTFTRGFLLALYISFLFFYALDLKNKKSFFLMVSLALLGIALAPFIVELFAKRAESDSIRFIQIHQVLEAITPLSFFIGHGFGIGVPIREMHMEIAYLEIFHKQGVLGLLFWFTILSVIVITYKKINNKNYIVKSFLVSTFFVYSQSATNPFLNNPIGMTVVLLSLIVLCRIRQFENSERKVIDV